MLRWYRHGSGRSNRGWESSFPMCGREVRVSEEYAKRGRYSRNGIASKRDRLRGSRRFERPICLPLSVSKELAIFRQRYGPILELERAPGHQIRGTRQVRGVDNIVDRVGIHVDLSAFRWRDMSDPRIPPLCVRH